MTPPISGAVRTGQVLVNALLVLALGFGLLAVVSIGFGFVRHGDSLLYGDNFTVPLQLSADDVGPLPEGVRLDGGPDTLVEVHDPTTQQMLLRSAQDLGPAVLVIAGLWMLRRFVSSVARGDPFGDANVRRLRGLGYVLALGGFIVQLVNHSFRSALYTTVPPYPGVHLGVAGFTLPGAALLGGLGCFILAEVFATGVRLREDVEATI